MNRVALVDQLGMDHPNPNFVDNIESFATEMSYGFDYFPPNTVTLDFFKDLPNRGLALVILRTHGIVMPISEPSLIVTSERYSEYSEVRRQLSGGVAPVDVNGTMYFGLGSEFVTNEMCGRFPGTVILAMYCAGGTQTLAEAFIKKGAGGFIGWDRTVTLSHTDQAFERLIALLLEGRPVTDSVQTVMQELGPDPVYGTTLSYYTADKDALVPKTGDPESVNKTE